MSALVAVQLTVVSPTGKTLPDAGVHSTAVPALGHRRGGGSKCTSVPSGPVASTTISAGQLKRELIGRRWRRGGEEAEWASCRYMPTASNRASKNPHKSRRTGVRYETCYLKERT